MTSSLDMIRGRSNVVTLTNSSGGALVAGDVCILNTGADESATTTTSANSLLKVYIAAESIAGAATGKFYSAGFCPLVTPNASVTRGRYLFTHTVAKQAAESATYGAGAFGVILKSGTTPSVWLFGSTAQGTGSGDVATDAIWDAAGDLAVGTGANTAAKLTKGAAGTVPTAGASTLAYAYPPGYQFDYVEVTSDVAVTATTEATATTVVTGSAVTYDGSTAVLIEFYGPQHLTPSVVGDAFVIVLYDGASSIGILSVSVTGTTGGSFFGAINCSRKITPSAAAHTYSIRAYGSRNNGTLYFSTGGSTKIMPGYIRITKAA